MYIVQANLCFFLCFGDLAFPFVSPFPSPYLLSAFAFLLMLCCYDYILEIEVLLLSSHLQCYTQILQAVFFYQHALCRFLVPGIDYFVYCIFGLFFLFLSRAIACFQFWGCLLQNHSDLSFDGPHSWQCHCSFPPPDQWIFLKICMCPGKREHEQKEHACMEWFSSFHIQFSFLWEKEMFPASLLSYLQRYQLSYCLTRHLSLHRDLENQPTL